MSITLWKSPNLCKELEDHLVKQSDFVSLVYYWHSLNLTPFLWCNTADWLLFDLINEWRSESHSPSVIRINSYPFLIGNTREERCCVLWKAHVTEKQWQGHVLDEVCVTRRKAKWFALAMRDSLHKSCWINGNGLGRALDYLGLVFFHLLTKLQFHHL